MALDGLDPASLVGFIAVLLATGAVAGVIAGLLGVGGGIVVVPVLFQVFTLLGVDEAVRMHLAVGTSLAVIIPTSISSARSHYRRGSVDVPVLKSWGPLVLLGVVLGTALASAVVGDVLSGVFAVVALLVAARMTFHPESVSVSERPLPRPVMWAIGLVIGMISAMMGIGGGSLSVPALTLCRFSIRRAVGTASAIGLIIAVPGAIGFMAAGSDVPALPPFSIGYVSVIGFACIVPATIATAPLGARIAHAINPVWLRRAFALFLFATSVRMFVALLS